MKFYTLWLSAVIVVVFILQNLFSGFTEMFVLDGNAIPQIWRFLTAVFLHGGAAHIVSNLFALIMFGLILESLIGGKRFLLVFFITGIAANLIAFPFYGSSLGASGAVFGVIGTLIAIRPTLTVFAFGLPMPMFIAGILWMIVDVIGVFVPSGVGNIAHLAGLFFGLAFGLFYRDWRRGEKKIKLEIDEGYMRAWEDRHLR